MSQSSHHFHLNLPHPSVSFLHADKRANSNSHTAAHSPAESDSSNNSHISSTSSVNLGSTSHHHHPSHQHVDTPYPTIELTETNASSVSGSSTQSHASFLDVGKVHLPHIPNPLTSTATTVNHHMEELRYGHQARLAKREARKSLTQTTSIPEYEHEHESSDDEKQKLALNEMKVKAWDEVLAKREKARTSCPSLDESRNVGGVVEREQRVGILDGNPEIIPPELANVTGRAYRSHIAW